MEIQERLRRDDYLNHGSADAASVGLLERSRQVTVDLLQRGIANANVDRDVSSFLGKILILGNGLGIWNYSNQ